MLNSNKRALSALLLAAVMVLMSFAGVLAADEGLGADGPKTITILHTNDMHGSLKGFTDYVAALKAQTENAILIDAGDATQGVAIATYSKGADIIRLMNQAGYDGMTLGNHEFDYGVDAVLTNATLADFPVASANTYKDGKLLLEGVNGGNGKSFIVERSGVKIAFIGITTSETAFKTNPTLLKGVEFKNEIEALKATVTEVKAAGADIVVGLTHVGIDGTSDPNTYDVVKEVKGLDIIIDGHSHSAVSETSGSTLIAQTGSGAANLGRITITFRDDGAYDIQSELIKADDLKALVTPDAKVTALYDKLYGAISATLKEKIGVTKTLLIGGTYAGTRPNRLTETNLGNLVGDAMVDGAKGILSGLSNYDAIKAYPIVAMQNGGGIRTTLNAGTITMEDVNLVLPFGNSLSIKQVTPKVLFEILEFGLSQAKYTDDGKAITGVNGGFPNIGGMRLEYTIRDGNRIDKLVLLNADGTDGAVLSRTDTKTPILFVSNDFLIGGGDGYTMLANLKHVAEGGALDVVLADYIKELCADTGSFTYPTALGRVKLNGASFSDYEAVLTISDASGKPYAEKPVAVSKNGNDLGVFTTDAEGKIKVSLASGQYVLGVRGGGYYGDALVDDTIGLTAGSASLSYKVAAASDNPPTGEQNILLFALFGTLLLGGVTLSARKKAA